MPLATVRRNGLKVKKLGKHGSRRFRTPTLQAGIPIGCVSYQREVVGDRCRWDSELLDHARFIQRDPRPAVQLDDARAAHALGKVLVGRADYYTFHTRVASRRDCPGKM